jgi:hypothetical protein
MEKIVELLGDGTKGTIKQQMARLFQDDKNTAMRNVFFTIFSDVQNWVPDMEFFKYVCYGGIEECPNTKRLHYHGYGEMNGVHRINQIKSKLPFNAHIEEMKTSQQHCSEYCKKAGSMLHEFGEKKHPGKKRDLKTIVSEYATLKDVMREEPGIYCRNKNGLADIFADKTQQKGFKIKNVVWIYGKTGTGKTMYAMNQCGDDCWKSNKTLEWFDGYSGEKNVLFDEFRSSKCSYEYLLELLDQYTMRVPVKGSHVNWLAENIYITSPYPPEKVYPQTLFDEHNSIDQLMRRITTVINSDETKLF